MESGGLKLTLDSRATRQRSLVEHEGEDDAVPQSQATQYARRIRV
jgi:hypothetical protein